MLRKLLIFAAAITLLHLAGGATRSQEANLDSQLFAQPSEKLIAALKAKAEEAEIFSASPDGATQIPLERYSSAKGAWSATNVVTLKLAPNLTTEDIDELIKRYNFTLDSAAPDLGVLTVRADLAEVFPETLTTSEWLAAAASVSQRYDEDPRVLAASPEIGLGEQTETPVDPTGVATLDTAALLSELSPGEHQSWGIDDIQAEKLWPLLRFPVQRIVAVFDTGFALHEDIPYVDGIDGSARKDHGNHVAGILCGLHNDKGFRGVLPYCGVRAKVHAFGIDPSEAFTESRRGAMFQSLMESFQDFVRKQQQVAVFNVSLGYNWHLLKRADPTFEFENNVSLTTLVEAQARFLYQVIADANARNIPIISAAGNDSRGLATPFDAKWASPFNYAALTACEARGLCNTMVVEAHDPEAKLAVFSNKGGDISCPGVNIESALAAPSTSAYGLMSGTSMASPFCAGGIALLSSLFTDRPVAELITCLKASRARNSIGTPMMRLQEAYSTCGGGNSRQ